ncbi:MAG: hypothetical protein EXX96DRAFT_640963 [Benjaminiella poitrasii]|nr:MAG: hypothetical protein EXX96DRAFT_640963 [Benjaminiella poitrasii]
MHENESDIFISGSDNIDSSNEDVLILLSPRSLQLLHQIDLLTPLIQHEGVTRHWRFEIYQNRGYSNLSVHSSQPQSIRLWDNENTEFNYSVTCKKSLLRDLLQQHLQKKEHIQIDHKQEIMQINEQDNDYPLSTTTSLIDELSLYYQYRPLPGIPSSRYTSNERKTPKKFIYLKHTDTHQTKLWKSQVIVAAEGQQSFIRRKLGILLRKLHFHQDSSNILTRVFYTLQIEVISTNFPGTKQLSTVRRRNEFYITFEHKPSWSKVSIDEEIALQVTLEHIRSVLEPYKIEFGSVKNYSRWQEYSYDSSYFLIGDSAQTFNPPGTFDVNLYLEQIQNLYWKLALSLRHSASTRLLSSYDVEAKSKAEEVMYASHIFTKFIGDYYRMQDDETSESSNASHGPDIHYQLEQHLKHCFVGDSPLVSSPIVSHFNLYHQDEDTVSGSQTLSRLKTKQSDETNASMSSFEFISPSSSFHQSNNHSRYNNQIVHAGCLAPNAKLKPYTLFQLLLMSSDQPSSKTSVITTKPDTVISSALLATPSVSASPPQQQEDLNKKVSAAIGLIRSDKKERKTRKRSNSVTSGSNGSLSSIWSLLQKNIKKQQRDDDGLTAKKSPSPSNNSTPASVLVSSERWKSIRTNHLQLYDRIQNKQRLLTFTILIFCGAIENVHENNIYRFVRQLVGSSSSFIYRYYDEDHPKNDLLAKETADSRSHYYSKDTSSSNSTLTLSRSNSSSQPKRASISDINSRQPQHSRKASIIEDNTSPRGSVDSNRTVSSNCYDHRYSTSSMSLLHFQQQQQLSSMFSILFITSSTKSEAIKYLNNTPPAMVHSTFPSGLSQVLLDHDQQCYKAYGIKQPEVIIIRPDGYIGTRLALSQDQNSVEQLNMYFDSFLRVPVDMNSAAAVVAADYDC